MGARGGASGCLFAPAERREGEELGTRGQVDDVSVTRRCMRSCRNKTMTRRRRSACRRGKALPRAVNTTCGQRKGSALCGDRSEYALSPIRR